MFAVLRSPSKNGRVGMEAAGTRGARARAVPAALTCITILVSYPEGQKAVELHNDGTGFV